jgi:hypothetical protein
MPATEAACGPVDIRDLNGLNTRPPHVEVMAVAPEMVGGQQLRREARR